MSWIKMNHALLTSPEVVRISSALDADRLRTVGALYVLWCAADMHAEYLPEGSGLLPGYTLSAVDATVNWPGFAEAVAKAGWLVPAENGLILPHFERHNGASAKRRAMDLERKKSVRKMSASKADKMRRPLLSSSLLSSSVESLSPEGGTGGKPYHPGDEPQWSGPMDTPAVRDAFDRWYAMRRERAVDFGPAPRGTQLMAVVGRLTQWGPDRAVAALDLTTANGWKNIREPTAEEVAAAPPKSAWEMAQEDMAKREARRKAKANGQA